jgi:hypothetical protein
MAQHSKAPPPEPPCEPPWLNPTAHALSADVWLLFQRIREQCGLETAVFLFQRAIQEAKRPAPKKSAKPAPPRKPRRPHNSDHVKDERAWLSWCFDEDNPDSPLSAAKHGELIVKDGVSPRRMTKQEFAALFVPKHGASSELVLRKVKYLRRLGKADNPYRWIKVGTNK